MSGEVVAEYSTWRGRGSLEDVVKELTRQRASRVDFVADTRDLKFDVCETRGLVVKPNLERNMSMAEFLDEKGVGILPHALRQIGQRAKDEKKNIPSIPVDFLTTLATHHAHHAAEILNRLLGSAPRRRMLRILDGNIRAWVSDQYRVIDNLDLAFAALDTVKENDGRVFECNLSDSHMRLKFTSTKVWQALEDVRKDQDKGGWYAGGLGNQEFLSKVAAKSWGELPKVDDLPGGAGTAWPVVTISNSEVGCGGFYVRLGMLLAICFNLATVEEAIANVHLGKRMDVGMWRPETVDAETKAIMMKSQDTIATAFNPEKFAALINRVKASRGIIVHQPAVAVDAVVEFSNHITQEKRDSLLEYFIKDEQTMFGLGQAVARLSQDTEDSDIAEGLEKLAGQLLVGEKVGNIKEALVVA